MSAPGRPIGFVGIGNMGGAMARRVLAQGGAVVAFDPAPAPCRRLAESGATIARSPADVARSCRVVSVVVNTDDQVLEAINGPSGVVAGAPPGTIVAIHSTIHLDTLEAVAKAGAARSVQVLDAAVTGGVEAAARGELAVLLGGDPATVEAIRPALADYASLIWRAGDLGAGMAAKIAIMAVSFGKLAATYEGLLLAHSAGVDPVELARVIAHSEAQSGIGPFFLESRARSFVSGDSDDPMREIGRHEAPKSQKDLHAAIELAGRLAVDLPVARAAHDEMPAVWGL